MASTKKVAVIGSGNWGSAIARIIGENVKKYDQFDKEVKMYVFEEVIDGQKLSDIINTQHENIKYLKGYPIPTNVVAIPDVYQTAHDADILVFVLPHKFIRGACEPLKGKIREGAIGISLVKGFDIGPDGGVALISDVIHESLGIPMCVLMGANLAPEVAAGNFCETTIGCEDPQLGRLLKTLIETDYFRVTVVKDVKTVELCGALKNIVACGAGFVDGLQLGDNTKAAVIRIGLVEMMSYAETFFPGACKETFFESCGVADLITTCYGGRNRRIAEAFVKTKKSIQDLEKEMLNGMKSQGPQTAEEVYLLLKSKSMLEKFPLFVAIHRICIGELPPEELIRCLQDHPAHHHSHL